MTVNDHLADEIVAAYMEHLDLVRTPAIEPPEALDLSMPQFRTLLLLRRDQPATISQLAQRMGVGLPTSSHLVDRLVQAGLVERYEDAADRRRTLCHTTEAGDRLVNRITSIPRLELAQTLPYMDPGDAEALLRGLRGLAKAIRKRNERPSL